MVRPFTTRAAAALTGLLAFVVLISDSFAWRDRSTHDASGPSASDDGSVVLELNSYRAGEAPAQRITLAVDQGAPEIYHATLTYPPGFMVLGLGHLARGTAVGALEVDADLDGNPDRTVPLIANGVRTAFADVLEDGVYQAAVEPGVFFAEHRIELRLPMGGDINIDTVVAPVAARLGLRLTEGIVQSPALGGRYVVTGRIVTVDPDTDGADDGAGAAPTARKIDLAVSIEGPRMVRFSWLSVRDFDVFLHGRRADRFELEGRFALGRGSDGIDPANEHIAITVGTFRQTVPGAALVATGDGYRFRGRAPGIVGLSLRRDGHFAIDARGLHWDVDRRTPVRVVLEIGTDVGEAYAIDRWKRSGR